jgi:hypothetical protein
VSNPRPEKDRSLGGVVASGTGTGTSFESNLRFMIAIYSFDLVLKGIS